MDLATLNSYDHILVMFSGGKDSIACVLDLIERGVDRSRIELWHHDIDGREGSRLMDWRCTPDYCRAFARAFGLKMYFSWKVGGFEGELTRDNVPTNATRFETPDGIDQAGGTRGKPGTRRKFPQTSADLSVRWCSAYLKIDVATIAIRNQPRFRGKRTLVVTGERAEESAARACYKTFEADRADNRNGKRATTGVDQGRLVDHYRPIHAWSESDVWSIIERWRVNPHPCYRLGWSRCSCAGCIFGNADQWSSLRAVNPEQFNRIADYEASFGLTIKRNSSIIELADRGTPYNAINDQGIAAAMSSVWNEPIIVDEWVLPAGAFGESAGPL